MPSFKNKKLEASGGSYVPGPPKVLKNYNSKLLQKNYSRLAASEMISILTQTILVHLKAVYHAIEQTSKISCGFRLPFF
jgi:hypothetical protein